MNILTQIENDIYTRSLIMVLVKGKKQPKYRLIRGCVKYDTAV